jgi:hypothetical protein
MYKEKLKQFRELQEEILKRAEEVAEAIKPLSSFEQRIIDISNDGCVNVKYRNTLTSGDFVTYYNYRCITDEEMSQDINITIKENTERRNKELQEVVEKRKKDNNW